MSCIESLGIGGTVHTVGAALRYLHGCDVANTLAADLNLAASRCRQGLLNNLFHLMEVLRRLFRVRVRADIAPYWRPEDPGPAHTSTMDADELIYVRGDNRGYLEAVKFRSAASGERVGHIAPVKVRPTGLICRVGGRDQLCGFCTSKLKQMVYVLFSKSTATYIALYSYTCGTHKDQPWSCLATFHGTVKFYVRTRASTAVTALVPVTLQ